MRKERAGKWDIVGRYRLASGARRADPSDSGRQSRLPLTKRRTARARASSRTVTTEGGNLLSRADGRDPAAEGARGPHSLDRIRYGVSSGRRSGGLTPAHGRGALSFSVLLASGFAVACGSSDGGPQAGSGAGAPSGHGGQLDSAGAPASSAAGAGFGSSGSGGTSSSAGAGGASGASGAAESSAGAGAIAGKQAACDFASGLNIAWVNFANDVPNPDLTAFKTIFKNTHDAGGRIIRWWLHTNGTISPGYGSDGLSLALPQAHIDGLKAILKAAGDAGVALVVSLWSFDMLQENAGTAYLDNQALLEKDANRQAYIDKYLTPLVTAIKGTKGLYAWEIFNEPEGMGPNGWATHRTTLPAIQKTVNWLSAAIHAADPNVLVTSSAVTFDYCSKVSGKQNLYSDDELRAAGGKQGGTLDFYQVHYYAANGSSNSPFVHPASYWGLDKKLVIGEFAAQAVEGVALNDLGKSLYEHGYNGGWSWSYDADWVWPAEQGPLQALYAAHPDVGNCAGQAPVAAANLPIGGLPIAGVRPVPRLQSLSSAAQHSAASIHALAEAGLAARARAEAEDMVNRYPDSNLVREIERFTGAHRRRNLRSSPGGQVGFE